MINLEGHKYIKQFATYHEYFSDVPIFVRSPGRINLIGEHTDYNLGYAFPAAVGQSIYCAIAKSESTDSCKLTSLDFDESYDFRISELKPCKAGSWQNYCLGVVAELLKLGKPISGFNLIIGGDIPQGSGMSSSAALECATCYALNELFQLDLKKAQMAEICKKAEQNYVGVDCGIMDQYASLLGKKDHALLLDCDRMHHEYRQLDLNGYSIVLCNSNVRHSLGDSAYNDRRAKCEEGVAIIQRRKEGVNSLRDVSLNILQQFSSEMPEDVYVKCRYVLMENERVLDFSSAISKGLIKEAGSVLLTAQHAMRDEYDITCPEIDYMADFSNQSDCVAGARMMGGGFGGCTINLVQNGWEEQFCEKLQVAYRQKFGIDMSPIPIVIDNGTSIIK